MRTPNRLVYILTLFVILLSACSSTPPVDNAIPTGSPALNQPKNASQPGTSMPIPVTGSSITATLSEIQGRVLSREAQNASFAETAPGYVLRALGQVQTQTDGKVRLDFPTGTLLRLGPDTLFTMQPPQDSSKGLLVRVQLTLGKLWIILRGGTLDVETKSGVASVLGSLMSVSYSSETGAIRITCLEGHCSLANPVLTVAITTGQTAEVTDQKHPPRVGHMTNQDYQDWINNNPEAKDFVPAASAGNDASQVFVPNRPSGTVVTSQANQNISVPPSAPLIPVTGGKVITLGSCATVQIVTPPNPPDGVIYTAFVVPVEVLPKELPGNLISCAVKVVAAPASAILGANVQVCFPVPPTQAGFAHEWQSPWEKTDILPNNGQSCVIVPADAVNPSYTGLFNQ